MISSSCLSSYWDTSMRIECGHGREGHTPDRLSLTVTQPHYWHERKQGVKTTFIIILSRLWPWTSHLLPGAVHQGVSRVGKSALCFGRERKDGIKVSSPSHHGGQILAHSIPTQSSWTCALNARDILGGGWGRRPAATTKSLPWPLPNGTKTQMNLEKA